MMKNQNVVSDRDGRSRLEIGYDYETVVWDLLDGHGIEYESNPKDWRSWLKQTNTDFDIKVNTTKEGWLRVECKFTSKPIFHSWFVRDWLSRDCDVIVTNNKWNVPYADRILLQHNGKKLLDTYQFLHYILKLNRIGGNKYYLNRCVSLVSLDVSQCLLTDFVGCNCGLVTVLKRRRVVDSVADG